MKARALLVPALVFVALTADAQSIQLDSTAASKRLKRRAYFEYRAKRDGTFGLAPTDVQGSPTAGAAEIAGLPTLGEIWVSRGPNNIDRSRPPSNYERPSGRVLALLRVPPDDVENVEKIYLGSAGGGVWRSTDEGLHWLALSDDMPSPAVAALAVHPTNPRVILAGTGEYVDCGTTPYFCAPVLSGVGIYRSFNGGFDWTLVPIPDGMGRNLFTGAAVTALRFHPINHHIFATAVAMAPPGLPVPQQGVAISDSVDIGFSWRWSSDMRGIDRLNGLAVTDLVVDAVGNLYAAVSRFRDAAGNVTCNPAGVGTAMADTACGVWFSSNEGQTWRQVSMGLPPRPAPPPPRPCMSHGDCACPYSTSCNLATLQCDYLPSSVQIYKLALAPSTAADPPETQILYTVMGDLRSAPLGVYRTADGGAHWARIADSSRSPRGIQDVNARACQEQQADYDIYVGVDPDDPNTVYVGLTNIYQTTNASGTWPPADPPGEGDLTWSNLTNVGAEFPFGANIHADQHAILFMSSSTDVFFGNDGGVYRTRNRGLTFSPANGDLQLAQFYGGALHPAAAPDQRHRLLGGTQDNGLIQTPDGAANGWVSTGRVRIPPPQDYFLGDGFYVAIDRSDPRNWYGEAFAGLTARSLDGGEHWTIEDTNLPHDAQFAAPLVMDPNNPAILYSGQRHLWRTTDQMTTWNDISPAIVSSELSAIAVARITIPPMEQRTIYIADTRRRAWRSRNSGTDWTPINPPAGVAGSYITAMAVSPDDPQIVYSVVNGFQAGGGGHLFRSDDGGDHWRDRSASLPNIPFQSVAVNPTHPTVVYAGANMQVYISRDSGLTWYRLGKGLPKTPVFDMVPTPGGEQLIVFTHGRGAWQAPDAVCPATPGSCGTWSGTGRLGLDRGDHTATLLADGTVLVAGGVSDSEIEFGVTATAERYDPATGAWTATGTMNRRRVVHTATLLSDGRVLVVGGETEPAQPTTSEVFDPAMGSWVMAGSPTDTPALYGHSATRLADGSVLIAGGARYGSGQYLATAARFDPGTNTWSRTGDMNVARGLHTSTLLRDGTVLVVGGQTIGVEWTATAELYDPATDSWSLTGSLATRRSDHVTALLPDGTVLVAGGTTFTTTYQSVASAERYDPSTGVWSPAGSLSTGRSFAAASPMAGGKVVVSGGFTHGGPQLASADVYDLETNSWAATGRMGIDRNGHTLTLLPEGTVLAAGGYGGPGGLTLASSELYRPAEIPPGL